MIRHPERKAPMGELDENIRPLVWALNRFAAVRTIGSCGGHPNPGPPQMPEGSWYVKFKLPWTEAGRFTLEWLAWLVGDSRRAGRQLYLHPTAPPPWLNAPGRGLAFQLEGAGVDPVALAAWIEQQANATYVSPSTARAIAAEQRAIAAEQAEGGGT